MTWRWTISATIFSTFNARSLLLCIAARLQQLEVELLLLKKGAQKDVMNLAHLRPTRLAGHADDTWSSARPKPLVTPPLRLSGLLYGAQ